MKLYRAVQDGRVVRFSPEPLRADDFPKAVSLDEIEQDVLLVESTVRLWDSGDGGQYPHLHYVCPRCHLEHNVDLYEGDSNPRFACCDTCGWSSIMWLAWRPSARA
jgi:hypothetical protein